LIKLSHYGPNSIKKELTLNHCRLEQTSSTKKDSHYQVFPKTKVYKKHSKI
jgi:hypothetical protein